MNNDLSFYCKAYVLKDLRRFSKWHDGYLSGQGPDALADDTVVFIHPDFRVTATVYAPEGETEPASREWIEFCTNELQFVIPDELSKPVAAETGSGVDGDACNATQAASSVSTLPRDLARRG